MSHNINFEIKEVLERLRRAIRERESTDIKISGVWILVVIFAPILIAISAFIFLSSSGGLSGVSVSFSSSTSEVGVLFLSLIVGAIAAALIAVLYYKLIYRMNLHFKRSSMLRESLIDLLSTISRSKGSSVELGHIKTIHSELELKEAKRSPGLHAILSIIIPFYWLYVGYFLTSQWQEHEAREKIFFKNIADEFRSLGVNIPTIYWEEMPRRSPGLYTVLTLILGGLFAIYWLWTLIKDPEHHFISHRRFEDTILDSIESFVKV